MYRYSLTVSCCCFTWWKKSRSAVSKTRLLDWSCDVIALHVCSEYALDCVKNGSKDILVATDVAGRGIDIRYHTDTFNDYCSLYSVSTQGCIICYKLRYGEDH